MGYRGYGLPIGEVISEGNVGLMQAVKRFDPDKGFRLATYAMWWIRASIQEYILRSWSLVKMGTTAAQKKLFFNLRRAKSQMQALEEGDLRARPGQDDRHASSASPKTDVVSMNRRLGGDTSLNAPVRADTEAGEWQDWLVDDPPTQEETLGETQELDQRKTYLSDALATLNDRERRIFEARRLAEDPGNARGAVDGSSACRASASARSRCAPSRRCRRPCSRPRTPTTPAACTKPAADEPKGRRRVTAAPSL